MEELAGAVKRGLGLRPEGPMKEWLRGYDCNRETLNAGEAAQCLGVRRPGKAAERRTQLPSRCRGEGVRKTPWDWDLTIGRQMY